MNEVEALAPGQQLGRYELLAQVARGGMGQVWVARLKGARGFQKLVAIKTLLPELLDDKRVEQMLLEEARIASLIHNPNVVQTTELGEHRGYLYLVMEWVDGESLAFILKRAEERGSMPIAVAVNLVAQACRGLHAAHELTSDLGVHLGVVHRDVSPHNVLVTHSGVVKLVDFGIAKAMNQQSSFTAHGEVKGKFAFMAPEQVLAEDVDRRADVFALGITLYQLTTGIHPFKGLGGRSNVLAAITNADPPLAPAVHDPSYPQALQAVVLKALEKDPALRYQTSEELRVALESALPAAFAPEMDAQLRDFLRKTMGDRAEARREALRRFQLAADERALASLDGPVPQLPSQSAGSLRAIIVDGAHESVDVRLDDPKPSQLPTEISHGKKRRRGLTALLVLAAAAALGFGSAHVLKRGDIARFVAPLRGSELDARVAATPPVPVESAVAPSASAAVPVAPSASAIASSTSPAAAAQLPVPAASARPAKKRKASSLGLIAPEYAK